MQVSNVSAGPDGRQSVIPSSPPGAGGDFQWSSGTRPVAPYQSSIQETCTQSAAGPLTLTWVSRQCQILGSRPRYFVPDVVPAHKGGFSVHHHDSPAVSEVELKSVGLSFARVERAGFDGCAIELFHVSGGQIVAYLV